MNPDWIERWDGDRSALERLARGLGLARAEAEDAVADVTEMLFARAASRLTPFRDSVAYKDVRAYGVGALRNAAMDLHRFRLRSDAMLRQLAQGIEFGAGPDMVLHDDGVERAWESAQGSFGQPARLFEQIFANIEAAGFHNGVEALSDIGRRFVAAARARGLAVEVGPLDDREVFLQCDRMIRLGSTAPAWWTFDLRWSFWLDIVSVAQSFASMSVDDQLLVAARLAGATHAEAAVRLGMSHAAARQRFCRLPKPARYVVNGILAADIAVVAFLVEEAGEI